MNELLNADRAINEICSIQDREAFFFMVGAGISRPPVPTAREMIAEWKDTAEKAGRSPASTGGDALDLYEAFFKHAYTSNGMRQDYMRKKIQDQLLPPANYKLAKIVNHGCLTKIVVTTNFDTFLFKALGYLGSDPLLYDHPETAKARFEADRDEPQLLHVHGTYLFYDCANLKAQIAGRTSSMLDLLGQILADRSPLVVGYSGWPEDVFMTALKSRVDSGRALRNNVYWFCYRQEDLIALPDWLRNHPDVFFVVPEDKSNPGETRATFTHRNSTSVSAASETTLPAEEIFERFINVLRVPPSAIDIDPVNFFISRLKGVLLGFNDANVASISKIVKAMREGYEKLEAIKQYLTLQRYAEASALACELSAAIGFKYSDSTLAQELAEIIWKIAAEMSSDSKEVVCLYESVARLGQWLQSAGISDVSVRSLIAKAWAATGVAFLEQEAYERAIDSFDRVIATFANDEETAVLDPVTSSTVNKGIALCRWHEPKEQNAVYKEIEALYDSVIDRYEDAPELAFRESLASAKVNKAFLLSIVGRQEDAVRIYNEVIDQFSGAVEPAIGEHVARAMINKAFSIGCKHQPDSTRASIALYRRVVEEFPSASRPSMRAKLALAWNGLGFQRLLLAKWQLRQRQDATATLNDAFSAIKKAQEFDANNWLILGNQAYILFLQGKKADAHRCLALAFQSGGQEVRQAELSDTAVYPLETDAEFKAWLNDKNAFAAVH